MVPVFQQMRIRLALCIVLFPLLGTCGTDVGSPLSLLRNEWGKGSQI